MLNMHPVPHATSKENVKRFDDDVRKSGSYAYTTRKLSAQLANARISESIARCYDFSGKRVLDLGCGDGVYTLEFPSHGAVAVLGIDPAAVAVDAANRAARLAGLSGVVSFETGNIYDLTEQIGARTFDCVVLRGVLHHLPDPEKAIASVSPLARTVIVLEPNGLNPIVKVIEIFSRYHIAHEERSFFPATIKRWCEAGGLTVQKVEIFNLVPFFCPDWLAKACRWADPIVGKIWILRAVARGQCLILATR